ncbi:MAG: YitT family protein [Tabrizicola sp.]|nr:YitT family protein [Tabrizicola sp.]
MSVMAQTSPVDHGFLDDAQGIGLGVFLCSLGIHTLTQLGLITGQTAGVAAILSYLSGWSFGAIFFLLNIPFYILGWRRLGRGFALKSILSVTALSVLTTLLPLGLTFSHLSTPLGAAMFGALTGLGLLAMFRHNGSLGGLGVLALIAQDRYGWRAGYVQLAFDSLIFGVATLLFPIGIVLWSVFGALILNLIIAINHRRDRYIAT